MSEQPFKPSDVLIVVPPLCGTMERAEREFAAALIVRACQVDGDAWQAIKLARAFDVFTADVAAGVEPFVSLSRNPFFRPRSHLLGDGKFGSWIGDDAIELTSAGIEALRRWVRT
jgi:hypothetical protein